MVSRIKNFQLFLKIGLLIIVLIAGFGYNLWTLAILAWGLVAAMDVGVWFFDRYLKEK